MPPPSSPEARRLRLAAWLLSRAEPATRAQIYDAFPQEYGGAPAAAERKFSRDKDALRRLGYAVTAVELGRKEDAVGYLLDARACTLPRIDLGPDEAAVVWTAAAGALRASSHPLREELESALRKLVVGAAVPPPRAAPQEELPPPPEGVGLDGDAAARREAAHLATLVDAWERRKRLRVAYWRVATGEVVTRDVDVYGWASRRGEWIFVGWCHLRQAVRIFYLSRVRSMSIRGGRRQDPDYEVPEGFDVRRWSRQQPWDYDVHEPIEAAVRFRGALAKGARSLLPDARLEGARDGARVARLPVRNLRGLVRQALAWGPQAEVVAPEEGRALAREILARLRAEGAP